MTCDICSSIQFDGGKAGWILACHEEWEIQNELLFTLNLCFRQPTASVHQARSLQSQNLYAAWFHHFASCYGYLALIRGRATCGCTACRHVEQHWARRKWPRRGLSERLEGLWKRRKEMSDRLKMARYQLGKEHRSWWLSVGCKHKRYKIHVKI